MTTQTESALPLSKRSAAVHTLLGLAALVALVLTRVPRFVAYADLIRGLCAALGVGSVAAARAYLSPRIQAILESFSPTPPVAPPAAPAAMQPTTVADPQDIIKTNPTIKVPPGSASNVLGVVLLLGLVSLSGCGMCQLPTNAAVPKCVLEHNLVSCGETDGYALIPIALSVVGAFVAGEFNAAALVAELERQGVRDVPCVLSALEDYLGISTMAHRDEVKGRVHQTLIVALERKNMHGLVTVKLHGGHAVTAVVP